MADALASRLLKEFFGRPAQSGMLPRKICRWVAAESAKPGGKSLVVKRADLRLFVRRYRPHPENSIPLLLEVAAASICESARTHHMLTRRELEVLHWIAAGKSTREIGEILVVSPRTISKHTERIFQKLGVENRTAAASLYTP